MKSAMVPVSNMDNLCLHGVVKSHLVCVGSRHKHVIYKLWQKCQHTTRKIRLENTVAKSPFPSRALDPKDARCHCCKCTCNHTQRSKWQGTGLFAQQTANKNLQPTASHAYAPGNRTSSSEARDHSSLTLYLYSLNQRHQTQPDFRHRVYQIKNVPYFKFGGYCVAIEHCQRVKYKDRKEKSLAMFICYFQFQGNHEGTEEKSQKKRKSAVMWTTLPKKSG